MMLGARIPYFGRGLVSGLWIAFIGWFLHSAAKASYSRVVLSDLLADVPVARLMNHRPVTVDPGLSVAQLVDGYLMATAERAFPVADGAGGDQLLGIVALEDVRKVPREQWPATPVSDIMTKAPDVAVASPDETASAALDRLAQRDVEQLPVVDDGRLVGLLRRRDILRWLELQPRGRGGQAAPRAPRLDRDEAPPRRLALSHDPLPRTSPQAACPLPGPLPRTGEGRNLAPVPSPRGAGRGSLGGGAAL